MCFVSILTKLTNPSDLRKSLKILKQQKRPEDRFCALINEDYSPHEYVTSGSTAVAGSI